MKVLSSTHLYRTLNTILNIVYIFAVLIELPDELCAVNKGNDFRCQLSYCIQLGCVVVMCPLLMINAFRLTCVCEVKCIVELVTFACGVMWVVHPSVVILKYAKLLRPLRLLLVIGETSLIVPAYNLFTSVKAISKVLFPAVLCIYIYAIVGLYTFSGTFVIILGNEYSRCRDENVLLMKEEWTVYDDALFLCG